MKRYNVRFYYSEMENAVSECNVTITVPNDTTMEEVKTLLQQAHNLLTEESALGTYEPGGRTPDILLDYACGKYGWTWEKCSLSLDFSIDIQ